MMNETSGIRSLQGSEQAADVMSVGLAPVIVGLVLVAFLIAAFWWGRRRKAQEPRPPRPQEQPRRPAR